MSQENKRRPVRFLVCDDVACAKWPRHALFLIGLHGNLTATGPVFSLEMALRALSELNREGVPAPTEVPILNRAIRDSGLPPAITRNDRVVHAFPEESLRIRFINLINGLTPPEKDSGLTRFERCYLGCDFAYCQQLPPHGFLYLEGEAKPLAQAVFSEEVALRQLDKTIQHGLIAKTQQTEIAIQIRSSRLAERLHRADRLAMSLPSDHERIAEIVLGIRPSENGSGQARFEPCRCENAPVPHGSFYARGLCQPVTSAVCSMRAVGKVLHVLLETGLLSQEEAEAEPVRGQLALAGLLDEHELDGLVGISLSQKSDDSKSQAPQPCTRN